MIDYSKYKIIIENPKGSYKSFETDNDTVWNSYPLKGVTYPVDYGCIDEYKGEDEAELDIFVGGGDKNGYIKVWRLDVPEETKFFIKLTNDELADVLKVFEPVLLKHEILDDENFVSEIEKFNLNNSNDYLTKNLEKSLEKAKNYVLEYLPEIPGLRIEIFFDASKTIPEIGIGGQYDKASNLISIYINSEHKNIQENSESEILKTFSHEFAHATREQKIPWENCTLLEAFVTEGLAQSFEFEISGKKPIYAESLLSDEINFYWKKALLVINKTDFGYSKWFFGSDKEIKKWAGYAIGFWLVQKYCIERNKKPQEIIFLEAKNLIDF